LWHPLCRKRWLQWSLRLNWLLHELKASMFVDWRLMLRRIVTVTDIYPAVACSIVLVPGHVVFMVDADLRHHGIVHLPKQSTRVPIYKATLIALPINWYLPLHTHGACRRRWRWCRFLAKEVCSLHGRRHAWSAAVPASI
jgi:hypothetical protein